MAAMTDTPRNESKMQQSCGVVLPFDFRNINVASACSVATVRAGIYFTLSLRIICLFALPCIAAADKPDGQEFLVY